MQLIRLSDNEYPCTWEDVRTAALPHVLPVVPIGEHIRTYGFAEVEEVAPPQSLWYRYREASPLNTGDRWLQQWVIDDEGVSLAAHKARAITLVNGIYEQHAATIAGQYPLFERQTWPDQQREAEAYTAWKADGEQGPMPDMSLLTALAQERGRDLEDFVSAVMANVAAWKPASRILAAQCQRCRDQIESAGSLPDIADILDQAAVLPAI